MLWKHEWLDEVPQLNNNSRKETIQNSTRPLGKLLILVIRLLLPYISKLISKLYSSIGKSINVFPGRG
jgi:hypothetical protein